MRTVAITVLTLTLGSLCVAEDQLIKEDFAGASRPKNWGVNFGYWEPENGVLVGRQLEKDNHAAASRWQIPIQDGVIECRVRFVGAKALHIGFDPAPGELNKKGHLYSLVVTPTGTSIMQHRDKSKDDSENETCAESKIVLTENEWLSVRLEARGNSVHADIAQIDANSTKQAHLEAERSTFGVKKPAIVFRVIGGDIQLDDIHVIVKK